MTFDTFNFMSLPGNDNHQKLTTSKTVYLILWKCHYPLCNIILLSLSSTFRHLPGYIMYNLFMHNKQFPLGQARGWMSSHGAMFSRNPSER